MSEEMTAARIRIECIPTATEAERPIRLILATAEGETITEMKFTSQQAWRGGDIIGGVLGRFIPDRDARRLIEGLRNAVITVRATRN